MPMGAKPLTMNGTNPGRVKFGPFEADLHTHEIWKFGVKIKLVGQPFEVLAILLNRPGELVTREELREQLWPGDMFVDFDHGLNAAVNKLREALNDSVETPRYVETLPRRGYRFIARVAKSGEEANQPAPVDAPSPFSSAERTELPKAVEPARTPFPEVQFQSGKPRRWLAYLVGSGGGPSERMASPQVSPWSGPSPNRRSGAANSAAYKFGGRDKRARIFFGREFRGVPAAFRQTGSFWDLREGAGKRGDAADYQLSKRLLPCVGSGRAHDRVCAVRGQERRQHRNFHCLGIEEQRNAGERQWPEVERAGRGNGKALGYTGSESQERRTCVVTGRKIDRLQQLERYCVVLHGKLIGAAIDGSPSAVRRLGPVFFRGWRKNPVCAGQRVRNTGRTLVGFEIRWRDDPHRLATFADSWTAAVVE